MSSHTPVGLILGLASSVLVFASPNQTVKTLSTISLGIGLGVIASSQVGVSEANKKVLDGEEKIKTIQKTVEIVDRQRRQSDEAIVTLTTTFQKEKLDLERQLLDLIDAGKSYVRDNDRLKATVKELEIQLREAKRDSESKLREISTFSESSAFSIANRTYDDEFKKLDGLVAGYIRNYPELREFFENLESEIDQVKSRATRDLENYSGVRNLQSLIDDGLSIQQRIISQCSSIKIKALTTVVRYLNDILSDSVALSELQNHLSLLAEKAGLEIAAKQNEVKEVASQWLASNEETQKRYETEFTETLEQGKYLVNRNQELIEKIEKLNQPFLWSVATRQDLRIGNILIGYFQSKGIILDRSKADFDHWQSTLSFHINRNNDIVLPSMLEPESERLQQLCHTLSPIKFGWNAEEGLLTAWLHLAKKPAKPMIEADINKIWKTADKFPSIVKGWSRVRLTGGSESGKSPTAENLAVCILQSRGGTAELYNPQDESVKNYWTLPTVGSSHKDSLLGIQTLAESVNGQNFTNFKLFVFDEIDSTMVSVEKKEQGGIGQQISTIIKQISHKGGGVIFIGQNANVSQYPGMNRSDWNSAINVHIGSNAYDAITNTNQITKEQETRLKLQADRLTEFCNEKNSELGLEKTNPEAYRFALVMGDGTPYFIQLPDFGEYKYDLIAEAEKCPECGSHRLTKNGLTDKGEKRRICKDCKHPFTLK